MFVEFRSSINRSKPELFGGPKQNFLSFFFFTLTHKTPARQSAQQTRPGRFRAAGGRFRDPAERVCLRAAARGAWAARRRVSTHSCVRSPAPRCRRGPKRRPSTPSTRSTSSGTATTAAWWWRNGPLPRAACAAAFACLSSRTTATSCRCCATCLQREPRSARAPCRARLTSWRCCAVRGEDLQEAVDEERGLFRRGAHADGSGVLCAGF